MIQFMIIAAPRSGTAWAANWLTTDATTCLHDPLLRWTRGELAHLQSPKTLGVACTGLGLFTDYVNDHPARKIVLRRDLDEVDASLAHIGMTPCGKQWEGVLEQIHAVHVDWQDLFRPDRAKMIYEYLLDRPFDAERWAVLREMNVQANFGELSINRAATASLMNELRAH